MLGLSESSHPWAGIRTDWTTWVILAIITITSNKCVFCCVVNPYPVSRGQISFLNQSLSTGQELCNYQVSGQKLSPAPIIGSGSTLNTIILRIWDN
jgi:hypothetical protein